MWRCDHVTTSPRTCSPAGLSDSQGTVGSGYLEASSAADWEDEAPQEVRPSGHTWIWVGMEGSHVIGQDYILTPNHSNLTGPAKTKIATLFGRPFRTQWRSWSTRPTAVSRSF